MALRTPLLKLFVLVSICFAAAVPARSQDLLQAFEGRVTEFTLDNGLRFIIIERHEAPVATFYTYADVGSVDETKGITGMAHMFEHMAFKGTTTVGTEDWPAEEAALREVDEIYAELKELQHRGDKADVDRLKALEEQFVEAQKSAQGYAVSEFEEVLERMGASGLNATTASDRTDYFVSLPANKAEVWFSLESDRFLNPVLREFYIERDVVQEERRMRVESNPFGRLMEEFFATAFKAHPYGEPGIGHMSDLSSFTREEAQSFFEKYYVPSNLTIAIAGDVEPDRMRDLAETYFGRIPERPKPTPVETVEPQQRGERRVIIEESSQPIVMLGWHKGAVTHPDDPVYQVLEDVLSGGRTSRMYRQLVEDEKIALAAQAINGFQGMNKYPHLFIAYGVTNQGHEPEAFEEGVYDILDEIRSSGVSSEELARAKMRARANMVRQLQSNSGLARLLTYYEVVTGDWRNVFARLEDVDAVTSADIQRVVEQTFTKKNRTVAMIKTEESTVADASSGE